MKKFQRLTLLTALLASVAPTALAYNGPVTDTTHGGTGVSAPSLDAAGILTKTGDQAASGKKTFTTSIGLSTIAFTPNGKLEVLDASGNSQILFGDATNEAALWADSDDASFFVGARYVGGNHQQARNAHYSGLILEGAGGNGISFFEDYGQTIGNPINLNVAECLSTSKTQTINYNGFLRMIPRSNLNQITFDNLTATPGTNSSSPGVRLALDGTFTGLYNIGHSDAATWLQLPAADNTNDINFYGYQTRFQTVNGYGNMRLGGVDAPSTVPVELKVLGGSAANTSPIMSLYRPGPGVYWKAYIDNSGNYGVSSNSGTSDANLNSSRQLKLDTSGNLSLAGALYGNGNSGPPINGSGPGTQLALDGTPSGMYNIGHDTNSTWFQLPNNTNAYSWDFFGLNHHVAQLDGLGNFIIGDVDVVNPHKVEFRIQGGNAADRAPISTLYRSTGTWRTAVDASGSELKSYNAGGTSDASMAAAARSTLSSSGDLTIPGTYTGNGSGLTNVAMTPPSFPATLTAATATVTASSDGVIGYVRVNRNGTVAISLTTPATTGARVTFKDVGGFCSPTNTITITPSAGTVDGAANKVIDAAYGWLHLTYDGTTWLED